jgi:hypothetical protein
MRERNPPHLVANAAIVERKRRAAVVVIVGQSRFEYENDFMPSRTVMRIEIF